jgi:hypothetical protein
LQFTLTPNKTERLLSLFYFSKNIYFSTPLFSSRVLLFPFYFIFGGVPLQTPLSPQPFPEAAKDKAEAAVDSLMGKSEDGSWMGS